MSKPENYIFIQDENSLKTLCKQLANEKWLAVDTEFVRDSTYYPEFCLLQIGNADINACIDVLSITDLSSVLDLIANPQCVKVFHAASQDLELFYYLQGEVPQPVFDTQIAAPLLGFPEQVGYASLVNQYLGIQIGKGQQRTDWSKRPLSQAQLAYAAGDVAYLAQIYPKMLTKLEALGRLSWLDADLVKLVQTEKYELPITDAWRRIKATKKLKGKRLLAAQKLAAWREKVARSENKPRNWILRDEALIDVANLLPKHHDDLQRVRNLKGRSGEKYYKTILSEVASAVEEPLPSSPLEKTEKAISVDSALVDLITALVQLRADQNEINANVLASRKAIEQYLRGDNNSPILNGWRANIIGEDIKNMIEGKIALSIKNNQIAVSAL